MSMVEWVVTFIYMVADDDDINHWPEVLKFLFECCSLETPQLYESALRIIR